MRAEIITTGYEVVSGEILNRNAATLAELCVAHGVTITRAVTVDDDAAAIGLTCREAASRADLVFVTGGLGPTSDDITLQSCADAFGVTLEFSDDAWTHIAAYFTTRGRMWTESNRKQALVLPRSRIHHNVDGSAPLLEWSHGATTFFFFPGVAREVVTLAAHHIAPWLAAHGAPACTVVQRVRVFGLPEAVVGERVAALSLPPEVQIGYRLAAPDVLVRVGVSLDEGDRSGVSAASTHHASFDSTAASGISADGLHSANPAVVKTSHIANVALTNAVAQIRAALHPHAYAIGETSLAQCVVDALTARGESVSVAESCTGGALAHAITNIPGASRVFHAGFVTYSNVAKEELLQIDSLLLTQHGAVSEPIARAMAEQARRLGRATYGIGITGIAGPSGGTADKPVGTVCIALATPRATEVITECVVHSREQFKMFVVTRALFLLWQSFTNE